MYPHKIRIKGVTSAHARETLIDLDDLPDGLIAILGPNGTGKTTLLEALGPLALFGRSPSRECNVVDLATAEDGAIELWGEHAGESWHALRKIMRKVVRKRDGTEDVKVDHEAYLTIGDRVIDTQGRIGDFDEEVKAAFLPSVLYLASIYAAQHGKGSFVGLKEADRRDLFADLLGIGDLQEKSETAKGISKAAADAVEEIDRRLVDARDRAVRFAELGADRAALEAAATAAIQAATEARAAKDAAQRTWSTLEETVERLTQAIGVADHERRDQDERAAYNRKQRAELIVELAELEGRVEDAVEIRRRVAEGEAAEAVIAAADAKARGARQALDGARGRLQAATTYVERAREKAAQLATAKRIREEVRALDVELKTIAEAGTAASTIMVAKAKARDAAGLERDATKRLIDGHDREIEIERRRVDDLLAANRKGAELLDRVPCGGRVLDLEYDPANPDTVGDFEVDCSTCELLATARRAKLQIPDLEARAAELRDDEGRLALIESLGAATASFAELSAAHDAARDEWQARRDEYGERNGRRGPLAAQVPHDLDERLAAIDGEIAEREEAEATIRRQVATAEADVDDAQAEADEIRARTEIPDGLDALRVTLQAIVDAEEKLPALRERAARLDATHTALVDNVRAATVREGTLRQELEAAAGVDPKARIDAACEESAAAAIAWVAADRVAGEARDRVASLQGALRELAGAPALVARLEAGRAELEAIHARHELLAAALGRKGLQAHEIDGAGPLVSGLVNDLLGACYGPRFRVELVTRQEASGGRKEKEVFDLRIWDGERGDRRSFDGLSGGEQVVIDEALKLALALLTTRRSGIRCGALFRDEVDGKLDHDNADRYPAMLRRAAEIGGFRRVFFVSHRPEVYGQADGRIVLGGAAPVLEG